jgi:hypothetical protein
MKFRSLTRARTAYCQEQLMPRILEANRHERPSTARS